MSKTEAPKIDITNHLQSNWSEQEIENVKVVVDFFQKLMNEHNFEYILETYGGGSYTQHNRAIPNEMTGLIGYVKTLTKRFPDYSFDVKKIFADGDFVILYSHTTMKAQHRGNEKKGFIITDTFRLENGKLAEHWDAIQPIDLFSRLLVLMTGGNIGNNNPTF
ncbi:polyketide cyclase [Prolixibacteraceae bacterium JC049]|nr:polyketide cyclase [Prolixibacteraceae bacterium JC049]